MRILVVEDDVRLSELVVRGLRADGLVVDLARTGEEAQDHIWQATYDAIVLDVGLPDMDGFELCERLRASDVTAPIIMLTARTAVADRVSGLNAGADDYLAKPFAFQELLARLHALSRRGAIQRKIVLEAGDLVLNPQTHEVARGDTPIDLSQREFALLEAFMRHPGQVLSRDSLLNQAWPHGVEQKSNVIEVYVRYLREKIDRPFGVSSIENVRGVGYRLRRDGGRE